MSMVKYKVVEITPEPYKFSLELQESEATYSRDKANRVAHLLNKSNSNERWIVQIARKQ